MMGKTAIVHKKIRPWRNVGQILQGLNSALVKRNVLSYYEIFSTLPYLILVLVIPSIKFIQQHLEAMLRLHLGLVYKNMAGSSSPPFWKMVRMQRLRLCKISTCANISINKPGLTENVVLTENVAVF